MICNTCGGSESYIQDGVEYCRECSEQIKGSIDEEAGDEVCIKRALLSSPVTEKVKKEEKSLAPWLYFEAYNLILYKQVSALMKLGCSEKLKTVVLSLWVRYLQKCGSAFIMPYKGEKFIPRLSVFPLKRDIELLYGEGLSTNLKKIKRPYVKRKSPVAAYKRKRKSARKTTKTQPIDSPILNSEISGDESTESFQNPTKKMKGKKPRILYSSHARKLKEKGYKGKSIEAVEKCISHMTLTKTLSFCHLGLLYTEDQMMLSDLIRLVNEDVVPFFDVLRHFPNTMQLQFRDHQFFRVCHPPDIKKISLTSARLIDFLQLPKFKEPPLLSIAIRFVKDLNLPCDLIPVLKLLISKLNQEPKRSSQRITCIPSYEAQALSVVAVALKMLFVLDGKFEMEHSKIMTKLNSISEDKTYFVWKDWQQQMSLKEFLFIKQHHTKDNAMNSLDILSADRINGSYPVNSIYYDLAALTVPSTRNFYNNRNELRTLFESLIKDSSIRRNPTSFPLQYELQCLMNDWKRLPLFKETENIDFHFICKDFSHHRLHYRPTATTDEPVCILLSSLYESVKHYHITDQEDYLEKVIRTTNKYRYLNHAKRHLKDDKKKWLNDFPSSFKWLFNFMCKYLRIDMVNFYREFRNIERCLIKI